MAFFKATRDQLKANAFVSHLEYAKARFSARDLSLTKRHVQAAQEAIEKIKSAKAQHAFSREGWLYAANLCMELCRMFSEIGQYRLSHRCEFMANWALWNEDQIGDGGVMSSIRTTLSPDEKPVRRAEPKYVEDNAETRIRTALDQRATELDLSQLELARLPESLRLVTGLCSLNLSDNQLTSLPEWIGTFSHLENLDLSGNRITNFPYSFGSLTNLRTLSICHTDLTNLPEIPPTLTALKELYVYDNQLTALPASLSSLCNLEKISASDNQITTLPDSLGKLTKLKELFLNNNQLTTLPESLRELKSLETLDVSGNCLAG